MYTIDTHQLVAFGVVDRLALECARPEGPAAALQLVGLHGHELLEAPS